MKKSVFGIFIASLALLSCSNDDDSLQKIDQILHFYYKNNAGQDVIVPNKIGSYTNITMNDALAETDNAPVAFALKTTLDSINYIEYLAGATRKLYSGGESDDRMYHSQIKVTLTQKLTDSTYSAPINDTLDIYYRWRPSAFEVSKVYYNKELKFTKNSQEANVVTIVK